MLFAFSGASVAAPAAAVEELPLAKPIGRRFPFGQLTFHPGTPHLTVTPAAGGAPQQIEIPFLDDDESELRAHARVLVGDFNFDGAIDLMIPTLTGYGGVNWFYTLYRYDTATRRFVRLVRDDKEDFCNPEPDAARKLLNTPCKSGPAWYQDAFQFTAGGTRAFRHRQTSVVSLQGFRDDSVVYLLEYRDAAQRRLRAEVVEAEDPARPAVRTIPAPRVYLHNAPDASSRTAAYIVKGDTVSLLDIRDVGGVQWLQVAYRSPRAGRLVRWITLPAG